MQVLTPFGHRPLDRWLLSGMEGGKMANITKIMDMLDWHMSSEIQSEGRRLAKNIDTIIPFIQPLTPRHNKNVWENCALIIAEEKDEVLKPYLIELLEWLQDMNWPGALRIQYRLLNYANSTSLFNAIDTCVKQAKADNDETWEMNLYLFLQMRREHSTGDGLREP